MLDFLGKVLNPVGAFIELGAQVLGLPPELANVAKIGTGVLTGNVVGVIQGGVGLTSNLVSRAQTEYHPGATPAAGYARSQSASDPRMNDFKNHLETIRDNFEFIEDSFIPIFKNGAFGQPEIESAMARPDCPPKLREALLFLKHNPDLYSFLDTANGVGWRDGAVAVNDVHSALYKVTQQIGQAPKPAPVLDPREKTGKPFGPDETVTGRLGRSNGDQPSTRRQSESSEAGPLDPRFGDFVSALEVLEANFRTYDGVVGNMDGSVSRVNLRQMESSPQASSLLKQAARFLLEHDEYFGRLEQSAKGNGRDGVVSRADLTEALRQARSDQRQYGKGAELPSRAPGGGRAEKVQGVLQDPTLSLEEKVQMLLFSIMDGIDDETLQIMEDLEQARADGNKSSDFKSSQKTTGSMEKMQFKLQQLIERRKQMFDLLTNFSMKFNEMAKAAIQNMARA